MSHFCCLCKHPFKVGESITGFDRYDDVWHDFEYDRVKSRIAIEFADNMRHNGSCPEAPVARPDISQANDAAVAAFVNMQLQPITENETFEGAPFGN